MWLPTLAATASGGSPGDVWTSLIVGVVAGVAGGFGHGLLVDLKERRIERIRRRAFLARCGALAADLAVAVEIAQLTSILLDLRELHAESFLVRIEGRGNPAVETCCDRLSVLRAKADQLDRARLAAGPGDMRELATKLDALRELAGGFAPAS